MIRKFEHGVLCLRGHDKWVFNVLMKRYSLAVANPDNQVFKDTNPLLAPRVLADWTYQ